ncbi:hypothetical protein [Nonomuraea basaltis]|uniref:hypothetical protein n=1 Tax=Nonomuraea basaltis TaxID=2495887 RepID=UPI001F0D46BF|nr:hypothetical protein [Nonomuraea basaltis]
MTAVIDWIRPWYPAGHLGHLYPDCEDLLRWGSEPQEGAGWLGPRNGDVCRSCLKRYGYPEWDAYCETCGEYADEDDDEPRPFTEEDAKRWQDEHQCTPSVQLIPPKPRSAVPTRAPGQGALL